MSYIICRTKKYKRLGVAHADGHNKRLNECKTNKDIDWSRTKYNIYFNKDKRLLDLIDKRLSEIPTPKRKRRKDAVYMTEILVTASPDFFKDVPINGNFKDSYAMDFFRDARKFIENKYGKENVLSVAIHLDEKTPHMHVDIVPIKDNKLNAKALFGMPNNLRQLQTEIWQEVGEKRGLKRGIPKDKEHRRKHLSVNEYKAKKDAKKAQKRINEEEAKIHADWDDLMDTRLNSDEKQMVLNYGLQLIAERREREKREAEEMVANDFAPK